MNSLVNITIDGKTIEAKEGENLLKVAKENGISIPSLCWHEKLSPTGACRLCLVKLKGARGLVASCTVAVTDGMEVIAFDDELENARREILDLLLAEHNEAHDGSYHDEFKELVQRYGLDDKNKRRFIPFWEDIDFPMDESPPVLIYDGTKCIKCFRCIKACDEIQGKNVLNFTDRGIHSAIVAGFGVWKESECDGCGECVQLCPTGAIVEKTLTAKVNVDQVDKKVRTTCTYCGVGCQMELWVQDGKIVRVTGVDAVPNHGRLCVKGRFGYEFVHHQDRLTKPLIKKEGKFIETTMDEALDLVTSKFKEIKEKHGGRALAGYSSAKCTNEENYLFQKLFRAVIGSNSVEHCARLCHASTVKALQMAIASGAMSNSIPEFMDTECILAIGSNPIETHPVTATFIKKGARMGTKIIVCDPRKTPLAKYAALWLKQKAGTDVALVNGFIHVIIKENLIDEEFIKTRVEGGIEAYENLKKVVEKYTPEKVAEITGVPQEHIIAAARIYGEAKTASIITGMGMSQSSHGTDNVLSLINMALITGNFGRESTGINPLRGQNNVQGASDMGGINTVFSGYQSVTDLAMREKMAKAWGINVKDMDDKAGLTSVEIIEAAYDGDVKAMYIMGENPMLSDPDLNHTEKAINNLDFLVVQDIFLTETAKLADVVLPASCWAEKEGTVTNTDRHVLRVRKAFNAPGDAIEDWKLICQIATRMDYKMSYCHPSEIMDEIASVTPSYGGINYQRIEKEPLQWPCPTVDHPGTKFLHSESFPSGLAKIIPTEHRDLEEAPDGEYPFMLNTGRTLYHYHTSTMTRRTTPLTEYIPLSFVEINPKDVENLGLVDGEKVKLISRRGEIEVWIKESDAVGVGELFLPFHFTESAANVLTEAKLDPLSRIPRYKQSAVRVERL